MAQPSPNNTATIPGLPARRIAADIVEGVLRVIPSHTLPEVHGTDDRLVRAARLSYVPDRSGDLFIMPKPYWLMSSAGTTHGTGYFYDERVPVLLFGAGIKPGKYWGTASPADLAPTLAALCGVTMARPDGRVLSEALAASATTPSYRPSAKAPRWSSGHRDACSTISAGAP